MKKAASILTLWLLVTVLTACTKPAKNGSEAQSEVLNIAYQYGLAYAPAVICQELGLVEKVYASTAGKNVTVQWHQMSSGADINTGIASGSIDAGFMGVAPAVTGITKKVGYKICTNLSGQKHGIMTNDGSVHELGDIIGTNRQVALVNIGSIQHILLAKALADNGYDAHALDSNIVAMKHPDGMTALETGNVSCHLTTSPYIYREMENPALHELHEVSDAWGSDSSFIVGVASEKIYNGNRDLYDALCMALGQAIDEIVGNTESAASITSKYDGNSVTDEILLLQKGTYSTATKDLLSLAQFMYENGFISTQIHSYSELVFDNVTGN